MFNCDISITSSSKEEDPPQKKKKEKKRKKKSFLNNYETSTSQWRLTHHQNNVWIKIAAMYYDCIAVEANVSSEADDSKTVIMINKSCPS